MKHNNENKLATGISSALIGTIYLLYRYTGWFSKSAFWTEMMDWRSMIVLTGLVFLIVKQSKIEGALICALGIIVRIPYCYSLLLSFWYLLLPIALLVIGLLLIVDVLRKR